MLRNRSLAGLVSAELVSHRLGDDIRRAAVVRAGDHGLGAKRTMLLSDAGRGALLFVIPILHRTGHLSFAALLGVTFAVGVFTAPYFASSRIVIPEVAGEDEQAVAQVNAVLSGA